MKIKFKVFCDADSLTRYFDKCCVRSAKNGLNFMCDNDRINYGRYYGRTVYYKSKKFTEWL